MAAGRIKGITIEIGGDTTKLVSSLKNVDSQIKNTQATLKDVNKLLKLDPGNTELLKQKQTQLNKAIGLTKDRLTELRNAQDQVSKGTDEWDALQREIIETEQQLKGLESEMKDFGSVAQQKIKVVGEKFQEVGGKIESAGRAMMKVSAMAAGAIGGMAKLGYSAVQSADELNTLAKQTGVSTDELQKWSYAADLVDVDVDTITSAMKKMKKNLDSNSDAFETLGVKTKDGADKFRSSTDIFYDTIAALSKIDNETERDVAAMEIFGKSADELAGVIDDGGASLKAYGKEAEELGLIIGGDTLDKLNEANDTIDRLKATIGASLAQAGATIAQTFAPAMEKVVGVIEQVAEKIRNLTPEQVEMITKILAIVAALGPLLIIIGKIISVIGFVMTNISTISSILGALVSPIGLVIIAITALVAAFVYFYNTNEEFRGKVQEVWENIKTAVSSFFETCKAWFDAFVTWISPVVEAVTGAFSAIWELVSTIVGIIVDYIKTKIEENRAFIEAVMNAIKLIFSSAWTVISNGVKFALEAIKTIFTTVFNVIQNLAKAFTSILKGDWKSALEFLKTAATTALNGVKQLFSNFKDSLANVFTGIKDNMLKWGREMIENLIKGIKDKIQGVKDAMNGVGDAIKERIHFTHPDVGPLKDFPKWAPDMMQQYAQGIVENQGLIANAVDESFNIKPYIMSLDRSARLMANNTSPDVMSSTSNDVNVSVVLQGGLDRLFRAMVYESQKNQQITGQSALMGV